MRTDNPRYLNNSIDVQGMFVKKMARSNRKGIKKNNTQREF